MLQPLLHPSLTGGFMLLKMMVKFPDGLQKEADILYELGIAESEIEFIMYSRIKNKNI